MSRIWLPLTIAVVTVFGVLLLLNQGESESTTPLYTQESAEEITSAIAPAPTVDLPGSSSESIERVAEETPKKSTDPRPYATALEEGGVLITVIDNITKEPLPLAHVIVIDDAVSDLDGFIQQQERETNLPRLFRRLGQAYKTNDQAQVRIPQPEGFLVLAAETKTHFDFVSGVDVSSGAYTLRISSLQNCVVRVVNTLGKPVIGVPALLFFEDYSYANPLIFSISGPDGLIPFRFFRVMREKVKAPVYAKLRILSNSDAKVPIDLKNLPVEPPVLVVPPTGSVEIKVIDEKGRPVKELYFMHLSILDPGITQYPNPEGRPQHAGNSLNYGSDRGILTYSHVETGLNLGVRVSTSNGDLYETAVGLGPKVPGEKVSFVLQPKIRGVLLTGRLLNAEGVVGKNISADVIIDSSNPDIEKQESRSIRTDDEGRFRVLMETQFKPGEKRRCQFMLRKTKRKPKRGALFDLSFSIPIGEYSLGDVVLDLPPLFAKGLVIDPNGEPVKRANLQVQVSVVPSPGNQDSDWRQDWTLSAKTKGNGQFEIRGYSNAEDFRLVTEHNHFSTAEMRLNPGDDNLVIQMQAPLVLKGRILVDKDISLRDLSLSLAMDDYEGTLSSWHRINADGTFSLQDMESASGTLTVSSRSTGEAFEVFDNLNFLDPGSAMRIANIDLRGRLHYSTLTVVDLQGEPIAEVYAKARNSKRSRQHTKQPIKLLTSGGEVQMQISAEGYRSVQLPRLDRDFDLVLSSGTPLRFHIPNGDRIHANTDLGLVLVFESDDRNDSRTSYITLKQTSQNYWEGHAGIKGRYRLQTSLTRNTPKQGGNSSYGVGEVAYFQIGDEEAVQDFEWTLPPKVVAFAERLAARED